MYSTLSIDTCIKKNGCAEGNGALWNAIKTDKHYLSANLVNKTSVCRMAAQHRPLIMTANAVRTPLETTPINVKQLFSDLTIYLFMFYLIFIPV